MKTAWSAALSLSCVLASTASASTVLTVARGPGSNQVTLAWSGGTTPYAVYRSTVAAGLVAPGNQMTITAGSPWIDTAAVAALLFYDVESFCTTGADCQDGNLCNGTEVCSNNSCVPGVPVVCGDDGVACTTDACDPATGACAHSPDDNLCSCGETCDPTTGCINSCVVRSCAGHIYACGDCIDNDGDCRIDANDSQCLGACDNSEGGLSPEIPGAIAGCNKDCFFDQDGGSGNDDCYWTHRCDPLEVPPDYPPSGSDCAYNPGATNGGLTCTQMLASQSATCSSTCGPLTPNGCDCFGCCTIPGAPTPVYLGSADAGGVATCTLSTLNDPALCKPCTMVPSCNNPCDTCELCVGKTTLPAGCSSQTCPPGAAACGLPGQPGCPGSEYCVSGCCQPVP